MTAPKDKAEFTKTFQSLLAAFEATTDNPGSYKSSGARCSESMFTTNSEDCYRCTYCDNCSRCSQCTQCKHCVECHHSTYCEYSERCTDCSYVVYSRDCYGCVFCFGCVGLVEKEFHILNEPYPRDAYFKLVKVLTKALKR